jgi:phosphoribosylformylglycinamidine cyclo-ligase
VLPKGVTAVVEGGAWPVPPVFGWLARAGGVAPEEMARVFNCGIGMVLVVGADAAGAAEAMLREAGETAFPIGTLEAGVGEATVRLDLPESWPA